MRSDDRRLAALRMAREHAPSDATAEEIVRCADLFYGFLNDGAVPDPPEDPPPPDKPPKEK